jgi:hypothetical protein
MDYLEEQVTAAIGVTLTLAYAAARECGSPGSPEFLAGGLRAVRFRQAKVWTLPADPDEWMRQAEADSYQLLLDVPALLEAVMMRIAEGEADV